MPCHLSAQIKTTPAMTHRMPANSIGGRCPTPIRITRYVVPQITQTLSQAITALAFSDSMMMRPCEKKRERILARSWVENRLLRRRLLFGFLKGYSRLRLPNRKLVLGIDPQAFNHFF